jgi:predicted CoA-substrate-specific enzyme activase
MYFGGVDIGAATAKAVILDESKMVSYAVMPTGPSVPKIAKRVLRKALKEAKIAGHQVSRIVATGYGRISVPFEAETLTEITCHAKGAHHVLPETRLVIDIGGQDSKAIRVDREGNVTDFVMNDKCAAGTGRFLEVIARVLHVEVCDLGRISVKSRRAIAVSSVCTVFAESEVVSLRAEKALLEDIVAGVHRSVAKRILSMVSQVGIDRPIAFTGGVAKNSGIKMALEEVIGEELLVPQEPQIIGALGAALFARELSWRLR